MYHCISPRKIGFFLSIAAVIGVIAALLMTVARALAAPEQKQEGVFLPVIMYHSITEGNGTYQVSPAMLELDLQYLLAQGYETVSAEQLIAYTQGHGALPEKPVLLTFDDGFYNNLSAALPLLERYDMCAVVSVVGAYTDILAEHDPGVPAYSYLTWENIKALTASGRVELGNHTYDLHSNTERAGCSILLGEDPDAYAAMLRTDLSRLQSRAKEKTGITPAVFAYPYGFICRESVPVLQELGFQVTLTCREAPNYITHDPACLYGLGRYHRDPSEPRESFFARALTG